MAISRDGLGQLGGWMDPSVELGKLAVMERLITGEQCHACMAEMRTGGRPLEEILVARGLLMPDQVRKLREMLRAVEDEAAREEMPVDAARVIRHVGPYALVERLGAGGVGIVWKAWDTRLHRWVAFKEPAIDRQVARERFLREARAAARMKHPNLIEVYEIGESEGTGYIVMEYVKGKTLDQVRLEPARVAAMMADVCDAVHAMHGEGVLHRDIKPQNILVDETGRARLGDFGLAKFVDSEPITREGALVGTPQYMAPEQVSGDNARIGARTDVYGLGATLYEALTGRRPYGGDMQLDSLFKMIMSEHVPSARAAAPTVARELDLIVQRAMAKHPEDRYASARELSDDLRRFLRGEVISARPSRIFTRAYKWVGRNRKAAVSGVAASVAIAAAVAIGVAYQAREGESRFRLLLERADRFHGEGRYGEADGYYRKALEGRPRDPLALTNRALNLVRLKRYGEAIEAASRALEADPSRLSAHAVRAEARVCSDDLDGAESDFQAMLDRTGGLDPAAYLGLAHVWMLRGDAASAELNYSNALELARGRDGAVGVLWESVLGRAKAREQRRDFAGAKRDVEEILTSAPPQWPGRAEALDLRGRVSKE